MSKEIKKLPKEVFDELKQLQGAIQNIEDIVSDDSCADWEFEFAIDRLTTDKEKEMAKKLGRIYMLAHSNNRSHSCYEVHKSWRKPSPQNSDSKPTTCNENCSDCPEEARKLNPLTPKVPDWKKEFDEEGYWLNRKKVKDFIRKVEAEATQRGYERGYKEGKEEGIKTSNSGRLMYERGREEMKEIVDRVLADMLTEFANTPVNKRGNGWDWILKARKRVALLKSIKEND